MDAKDTIASFIRAFHRTREERSGPNTIHTGEDLAAAAILDLLRANVSSLVDPDMFWDAACAEEPLGDLNDARDNTAFGEVTEIRRAIRAPAIFVTWLAPVNEDDDPVFLEAPSLSALNALVAAELESRDEPA